MAVKLQDCVVVAAGGDQARDGEGPGGQVCLDGVGEGDAGQVVLAVGTALQEELALLGDDDHFGRAAVAAGQGFYLVNDADVVMAEDANQLLGRKICAASGHKLMIIDIFRILYDQRSVVFTVSHPLRPVLVQGAAGSGPDVGSVELTMPLQRP